ncbi:endonuclease/exonuclease/phosphatase family protein [Reinekea blandensis]|uniref:Endonuclease/exonuclease/phosphatase domain-containing protein n=1 Tax=Reinekea blandensis MED297 TaxID=314283 RepID=A4BFY8_9GAMM|nr:endonuclease/exonuclease/phosphatase family protein [Reinekea blandensis]EAR09006.1 hypothetical protein MED297_03917 [Reinekea sp. MED297] [Reinekea blandensis MED297]
MVRLLSVSVVLSLLLCATALAGTPLRVASHNIHYILPNNPDDDWETRRDAVIAVIDDMAADILAFQEMESFVGGVNHQNLQLDWVLEHHPDYNAGAFSDNADQFPITQPILYRRDRFSLQTQGFFFFSETPDVIYSRQWDGRYPYFVSWVELFDHTNDRNLFVFNFHNDFASRSNRRQSSELTAERIEQIAGETPVILLGDFNAPVWFREVERFEPKLTPIKPGGSTNRILGLKLLPAIDHILISDDFVADTDVQVWDRRYGGEYPSDHFPISADIRFSD